MSFRSARLKAGKRVAEVVEHMKVTDAAVYFWETGQNRPTVDRLQKLAEFYGCTIEELLAPDDEGTDGDEE